MHHAAPLAKLRWPVRVLAPKAPLLERHAGLHLSFHLWGHPNSGLACEGYREAKPGQGEHLLRGVIVPLLPPAWGPGR